MKRFGYLRLRYGHFTVSFPDVSGNLIYEASTTGDGIFYNNERAKHLRRAKEEILINYLNK